MKSEKNTFIQKHWNNRHRSKRARPSGSNHSKNDNLAESHHSTHPKKQMNNKKGNSKKNTIYTPLMNGDISSHPVITPPPEVYNQEISTQHSSANSKRDNKKADSKKRDDSHEFRKRKSSKRKENSSSLKAESSAHYQEDKFNFDEESFFDERKNPNDKVQSGSLLKEFLSMLDESSSEASMYNEIVPINKWSSRDEDEDTSSNLINWIQEEDLFEDEKIYTQDDAYDGEGDFLILSDILTSIESSSSQYDGFKNHYISQKEMDLAESIVEESVDRLEVKEDVHEKDFSHQEKDAIYSDISTMLNESSSFEIDELEDGYEEQHESSSFQIDKLEDASMEQSESSSFKFEGLEDSSIELDESSSEPYESPSLDEEDIDPMDYLEQSRPLSEKFSDILHEKMCSSSNEVLAELKDIVDAKAPLDKKEKEQEEDPLLVKLPVLLSRLNVDIDIMESVKLIEGIQEVTKIEWNLQSLKVQVLSKSSTAFLSGVLLADIEYVSDTSERTFHSLKCPVYWDQIVGIKWLKEPIHSHKSQKEYAFKDEQEESVHYEHHQSFAKPIEEQLQSIHFVWHNELDVHCNAQEFLVQGNVQLCIDLLQEQYIHCYS
ncbi:hypothetical protein [Halobacillus mangrovi]|uniref:hypothetical protein n=1 Tax=Halobacillus mangrovi TaxID=402384 RepID=UPI003D98B652